jgi:hypothetical protein
MKAWAWLIALAAGEAARSGLRGSAGHGGATPITVVHHRHHHVVSLLSRSHSHHVAKRGVNVNSFTGEGPDGAYPEETGVAAPAAEPQSPAGAAPDSDVADAVFGDAGEAPTREELATVHKRAAALAANKPAPPYRVNLAAPQPPSTQPQYNVNLDMPPPPPLATINTQNQMQKTQTETSGAAQGSAQQLAAEQIAAQQKAAQQFAAKERQAQLDLQAAQQATDAKITNEVTAQAVAAPQGITRPKGWDQCLKFSRFTKAQGVTGMELVKTWKATCEPAVSSGVATERYKVMCNALGGTVEPFAAQQDYDVEKLCDAVLAVFHDVTAVDVKASS